MPSSVLSSDSMHLGLLAAAAHAAATNSRFTIFYNPRYKCTLLLNFKVMEMFSLIDSFFLFIISVPAHQNLSFP